VTRQILQINKNKIINRW